MTSLRSLVSILLIPSLVAIAAAGGRDGWQQVRGSGFTVSFPGTPQVQKQSRESPTAGKLEFVTYNVSVPGHAVCMIQDTNAVRGFAANASELEIEANIVNGFVSTTHSELVSATKAKLQGHDGLILMLKHGNEVGRGFSVNVGNHNFLMMAISTPSEINSPVLTQFLNSFRVTS